jgi:hypothetical protein
MRSDTAFDIIFAIIVSIRAIRPVNGRFLQDDAMLSGRNIISWAHDSHCEVAESKDSYIYICICCKTDDSCKGFQANYPIFVSEGEESICHK